MDYQRVFVLGGGGFLGSAFVRQCTAAGLECHSITRANYAAYMGTSCDVLIDAHGSSNKVMAEREPLEAFDRNVAAVRMALNDFPCRLYVLCSSCDVYCDFQDPYLTSEFSTQQRVPQTMYGHQKLMAELLVQHASANHLILRFGGLVGPGLRKNPIYDILTGRSLWVRSTSRLQYMHTDAAADIALRLIQNPHDQRVFNVCGRGLVMLKDVLQWAGKTDIAESGPYVHYDINIDCLMQLTYVPSSVDTVQSFVQQWLEQEAVERDLQRAAVESGPGAGSGG